MAELNRIQRTWRTYGEVTEDGKGSGGNGDHTERGVVVDGGGLWARGLYGVEFGEINWRNQS